jgi:hypothetical protein
METRKIYSTFYYRGGIRFLKRFSAAFLQIFTLFALLAGTSGSAAAEGGQAASTQGTLLFKTERIDTPKKFHWMSDRSLRLDSNKRPHIVYGGDNLYYLHFNGTTWLYETIDSSPGTGKHATLALDSSGRPHASYYDMRLGALKYARKTGSVWETFIVDAAPGYLSTQENSNFEGENFGSLGEGQDWLNSLQKTDSFPQEIPGALDGMSLEEIVEMIPDNYAAGQPDNEGEGLEPAYLNAEPLAAAGEAGRGLYSSIAVNNAGVPFISYYDAGSGDLKFARWNGTAWEMRILDSSGNVGLFTSIGLDSSGLPHISYYDASLGNLKYIRWNGSVWTNPVVVDTGGGLNRQVGLYSSITLDSDRNPHISYYDAYYGNLKYARMFNGSWLTYVIDNGNNSNIPNSNVGLHTSIAMDASKRLYISYYNATTADLKLATCTGVLCTLQTLVSEGAAGLYTSIVLDESNPRITFYEANTGYLKLIALNNGVWTLQNVDRAGDVGCFSSMALDKDGRPHIAYYDELLMQLKFAYYNGSSWQLTYVDEQSQAGLYASLALHPVSGHARISYYDIGKKSLKYASWNGSNWTTQVVDAGPEAGMHSALALDPTGQPRITYCRGKGCSTGNVQDIIELKVAVFNGSSWDIRSVTGGGTGLFSDIAVDKNGAIHISTYDAAAKVLKYVKGTPDGSSWNIQVADSAPKVGLYTSITLDSASNPHIAYLDDSLDSLRYAYWNGAWQTMLVDKASPVGWYPSIDLDTNDSPHISYYDIGKQNLKYIRKSGNTWITQVVDWDGEVGLYSSLVLKDGASPIISYYDATNGDLKFASSLEAKQIYLPVVSK